MRISFVLERTVDLVLQAMLMAAAGTGFTFLMTTLGAATVFLFRKELDARVQKVFFGFAAGVMMAASVWSMLIPAIEDATRLGLTPWLPALLGFWIGVATMITLDYLVAKARGGRARERTTMLFLAVTFHNVPEGMAVGLIFALAGRNLTDAPTLAAAVALAVGIGIQNFPEGAALSLPIWQGGKSPARAFCWGTASGAVEPVFGILAATLAGSVAALMPWLLAFAAGAMMYVVVEEMVPEAASRGGTLGAMLGFAIMMVLDVALG
jgi:ZIP family zinc transporter